MAREPRNGVQQIIRFNANVNLAPRRGIALLLFWQSEPFQKTGAFGKVFPA
ncbi:hypothetical protein LF934_14125 [Dickeya dadantii]|uniref:hypothetical protein n=1 Tax=Dickeya dadantii TaxID=204038 RepID=UPI001CF2703A|nr:hypothetical protein [Dickeya dadantii]MCA7013772.1 hypothetical protein [Dickeya dadantii]